MAKYTILYKDYLEDHDEPKDFELIEGFGELFYSEYADREIGFETEDNFELKLNAKAKLVMPIYKEKIDAIKNAIKSVTDNKRTTKSKTTDLPIDSTDAEPSQTGETEETGATIGEALARKEALERKERIILTDLLDEFKNLFMLIY